MLLPTVWKNPLSGPPAQYPSDGHDLYTSVCCLLTFLLILEQGLRLTLTRGPSEDLLNSPRGALWRWNNSGGTWTFLETAFTSYFLRAAGPVFGTRALGATAKLQIVLLLRLPVFTPWSTVLRQIYKIELKPLCSRLRSVGGPLPQDVARAPVHVLTRRQCSAPGHVLRRQDPVQWTGRRLPCGGGRAAPPEHRVRELDRRQRATAFVLHRRRSGLYRRRRRVTRDLRSYGIFYGFALEVRMSFFGERRKIWMLSGRSNSVMTMFRCHGGNPCLSVLEIEMALLGWYQNIVAFLFTWGTRKQQAIDWLFSSSPHNLHPPFAHPVPFWRLFCRKLVKLSVKGVVKTDKTSLRLKNRKKGGLTDKPGRKKLQKNFVPLFPAASFQMWGNLLHHSGRIPAATKHSKPLSRHVQKVFASISMHCWGWSVAKRLNAGP